MNRNIILITVDSLRADHCGFLGCEDGTTPTLDSLAEDSVVFENAIAPGPRTPSSVPVLFTGEFYQRRAETVYETWEEKRDRWPQRRHRIRRHLKRYDTIADELRELGYSTLAFTANPWTDHDTGFDQGFDEFHHVGSSSDSLDRLPGGVTDTLARLALKWAGRPDWITSWLQFFDRLVESLESMDQPYFVWVFLMEPHQPYIVPGPHRRENSAWAMYYSNLRYNAIHRYRDQLPPHLHEQLTRAYRDSIRSVDTFVRNLVEATGGTDPVLVFHSDHGEAFREHGTYGHRLQLYEENVHVPLLIHNIGKQETIDRQMSLKELPELLRTIATPDEELDPVALTSQYAVSITEEAEREAVRSRHWKYIRDNGAYSADEIRDEFFDLRTDASERENLLNELPVIRDEMASIIGKYGHAERARIVESVEPLLERKSL